MSNDNDSNNDTEKTDLKADYTNSETGLTEKDEHFLSILFSECGGDIPEALKRSGLNDSPFGIRKRLKTELQQATKDYLTGASAEAAIKVVGLLSDPSAPGSKTLLGAAKEILDRGGVKQEEETKQTDNYIFILPAKNEDQ